MDKRNIALFAVSKMNYDILKSSLTNLINYIEKEGFKGYDPYDFLNSWIPFHWFGKYAQVAAIQIGKRLPINIRPLLGIKKEYNPKGLGLLLQAYSLLYRKCPEQRYHEKMQFLFNYLAENYSKEYSGYCWGYNFTWASPEKVLKKFHPSIVVTSFVAKGIYEYYRTTGDDKAKEVLISVSKYILNDLHITEDENAICFSYTDVMKDCCYNASMLGAETLSKVYYLTKDNSLLPYIRKAVDFVIKRQHEDGHWEYSLDIKTGNERPQIDFHQGFILESLYEIISLLDWREDKYITALRKGLNFYKKEQFTADGISLWRLPKKYPVEIHNQAQGIITFAKLAEFHPDYPEFAKTIAGQTIRRMQSPEGYFYYRINRIGKNRIPFMRWSEAWMMVALASLYTSENK